MMSNEALMKPNLSNEAVEETRDIAPVYVDTNTTKIFYLLGDQTIPKLKLNLVDLPARRNKMNGVNITLEQGAFLFKDNIYEFSDRFIDFFTEPIVSYGGLVLKN